jgi:hypothetical protein
MVGQSEKFTAVSWSQHHDVPINYVAQVENCDETLQLKMTSLERTAFCGLKAKDGLSRCLDF